MAARIADPLSMTERQINQWVSECRDYLVNDAVSEFAAQLPSAAEFAARWIKDPGEFTAATGWNVITHLAMANTLDPGNAGKLIPRIRGQIHAAPNRTRYSMNGALIAIGGSMPELADAALAAAKAIGTVTVDHGKTGCKTPDAASYMARMIAHAAKRSAKNKA